MSNDLIEGWRKLRLIEEEEDAIDLDEIPDEELECQVSLALVGKLFTQNSFNIEALKFVLRTSWKPTKEDREKVIEQGPWAFDNHLLLLREISGREQPRDLVFDAVDFWVKVYNVPFVKRTRYLATTIGSKLGKLLDFDETDISTWAKYMRIRVRLNVNKPLPRGSTMKIGGEKIWVEFRMERLSGLRYVCGCLGHNMKECNDYDDETPESELPYGAWLRASPIKMHERGGNPEREVENKMFQDLRSNAKRRLNFPMRTLYPMLRVHQRVVLGFMG
ncbi:hypothetical protein RDABS01_003993 [Bienertia sinuspersici]